MDPIKVDFSKKGKSGEKEIVIPPEKAALKIIISILLTVVTAVVAFYFMLPAINFKSYDLYMYIGIVAVSYIVWQAILSSALRKPEYVPYVRKQSRVSGIIIAALVVVVAIGWIISCQFFRAKKYSKIISVDTSGSFADGVEDVDSLDTFTQIPRLDEDTATAIANRALGELGNTDYVSQFTIGTKNYQINIGDTPYRVAPLQYANIIKWLVNTDEGFPGYVKIDMADESAEFIECKNIRYSTAEHFGKLVKRQLRFEYPTYLFADATFEVDDEGNPYWICARLDKTIGLFGGTDVIGAVIMDATDGSCTYYSIEDIKTKTELNWIDRVYGSDLLVEQYNYYGKYQNGFWNSILGQKNVKQTTSGYSYIAMDNDVWMYTGITSATSDESIVGFVLVNQRTKEARFYSVSGGTEISAQEVAQGRVADLGYTATFPLLINIGGQPTYFMSLKDSTNAVQQYALINVKNYNNNKLGVNGQDLQACLEGYIQALVANNIVKENDVEGITNEIPETPENNDISNEPAPAADDGNDTVTGTVTDIRTAVINGESRYYISLGTDVYYSILASDNEGIVILNKGDSVTIKFSGSGKILTIDSITIN